MDAKVDPAIIAKIDAQASPEGKMHAALDGFKTVLGDMEKILAAVTKRGP